MRKISLFVLPLTMGLNAQAQVINDADKAKPDAKQYSNDATGKWAYGGLFNIGGNQGLLHNWAAGGELASLTVNGIFNGFATFTKGNNVWANNLDLNYGLNYAYSYSFIPRKTDDRIDFTSRYGRRLSDSSNIYMSALFNFKSQFTKGYDYSIDNWRNTPTSNFFAPAYFTLAPGFEYRKGNNLSVFISPVAGRLTVVDTQYTNRSLQGAYGVPFGKSHRFEFGAYFSARYYVELSKTVSFRTRLDLYSNYLAKDVYDNGVLVRKDNPGNITVLSDNLLSFKFNKHLNVSIGVVMMYDNAQPYNDTYVDGAGTVQKKKEPISGLGWVQLRQNLQFGVQYKFPLRDKTEKK
jgi:hypothetical protein